jgi:peptidoglycan/xylan/chitin deacetylase (PgdA/CDA1 family)
MKRLGAVGRTSAAAVTDSALVCDPVADWRGSGSDAAICFSIDDVHPATSGHPYEAGGDLEKGVLGHLLWLLERHPRLQATLFVTPDWRMIRGTPERFWRALPRPIGELFHLARRQPRAALRLDRHPRFCRFVRALPRTELALHGLHHVRRGFPPHVEFLNLSYARCRRILRRGRELFGRAELTLVPGFAPPGWHLSAPLAEAAADLGFTFVTSSRDLETDVRPAARASGSGLAGAPLFEPGRLERSGLLHFPTNFQATSPFARARAIVEQGGLLSIKAHAAKYVMEHEMADGLDAGYREFLHRLFGELEDAYGDRLTWTSHGELAARIAARGGT